MSNKAFVGRVFLARGDGGSPEVFTRVCQNFGISGLGQTNDLIEATTFCSDGNKEYIGGLADGAAVTLEMNFETVLPNAQVLDDMRADVRNKAVRDFEIQVEGETKGVVDLIFAFSATCLSWTLNPAPGAKNAISFGIKISGDIHEIRP